MAKHVESIHFESRNVNLELARIEHISVYDVYEDGEVSFTFTEHEGENPLEDTTVYVDKDKIAAFFKDLYECVQNADESTGSIASMSSSSELTLYYSLFHTEKVPGTFGKGSVSVAGIVNDFINSLPLHDE